MNSIFRTGVYGVAVQEDKLLLVKQQRGPHLGKLELPGGGIQSHETIEAALRREFSEEVGIHFESMQFMTTLTAITNAWDKHNIPYLFHQTGLIYRVSSLSSLPNQPEMEYLWITPKQLLKTAISPFVEQLINLNFYDTFS